MEMMAFLFGCLIVVMSYGNVGAFCTPKTIMTGRLASPKNSGMMAVHRSSASSTPTTLLDSATSNKPEDRKWDAFVRKYGVEQAQNNDFDFFGEFSVHKVPVKGEKELMEVVRIEGDDGRRNVPPADRLLYMLFSHYPDMLRACLDPSVQRNLEDSDGMKVMGYLGPLYTLLLGNSGIGKSFVHFIVLCAVMANKSSKSTMEALQSSETLRTVQQCLEGIDVVIRQNGANQMAIYRIGERGHYECEVPPGNLFFDYFDANRTLYIFEPGPQVDPVISPILPSFGHPMCKMLCTMSPNPSRYAGFAKMLITRKVYMPLPGKQQIVAMGQDMVQQAEGVVPTNMLPLFSEDALRASYDIEPTKRFNIVLDMSKRQDMEECITRALEALSVAQALHLIRRVGQSEESAAAGSASHVYMDVPKRGNGKYDFSKYVARTSPAALEKLNRFVDEMRAGSPCSSKWFSRSSSSSI